MPFWAWLLIDFGVLILGAGWWTYLLWDLYNRGKRIVNDSAETIAAVEELQKASETTETYEKPATDLASDPVKTEAAWLRRKANSEQKKLDRQRRLIARLRK
jgi:hypothetical protein